MPERTPKQRLVNELVIFAVLLFVGYIVMPIAIFFTGDIVFGDYGDGYLAFFGGLTRQLLEFSGVYWFLVLSPWLAVQALRLTLFGYRSLRP